MEELSPYAKAVIELVRQIPEGKVMTYGAIAYHLQAGQGSSSARMVGQVMSRYGWMSPWWRVVRADGTLPRHLRADALANYETEATPLYWRQPTKVDLRAALWEPTDA
ncbi:MAG: MGMT family protein [Bowdeniella nasicola]|nr:MGMT family protein [Bowdeniella nasicola]